MIGRRQFLRRSAALALSAASLSCGQGRKPNIIILFSDELSLDDLGCYGGDYPTPHLDALAAGGVLFTRAYSAASMCTPSRYSLLTGRYPGRCRHPGFVNAFPENVPYSIAWNTFIDASVPTLARILSRSGYMTGMVGKWHAGRLPAGIDRPAFKTDENPADPDVDARLRAEQTLLAARVMEQGGFDYAGSVIWENNDNHALEAMRVHNFPWITRSAVKFIERGAATGAPFLLYAATTAVHGPNHTLSLERDLRYTPGGRIDDVAGYGVDPEEIRRMLDQRPGVNRHRLAGVADLDAHVGRIVSALHRLGIEKETLIFFLSDHNIEPGKATAYEKGVRIPMIAHWPGVIPAGRTCGAMVQSIDLMPTALEVAGTGTAATFDGRSIYPLLRRPELSGREWIYIESGYTRAVTDGRFKYLAFRPPPDVVQRMERGELDYAANHLNVFKQAHSSIAMEHYPAYFQPDQLYDLQVDPYEQHNLAADPAFASVLEKLRGELARFLADFNHPFDLSVPEYMLGREYQILVRRTLAVGTGHIPWLRRDHGRIVWPPE